MGKLASFNLDIDRDYLEEAVGQTVMMGIAEALNGKNEIVSGIVHEVLSAKVDSNGNPASDYEIRNGRTCSLLEHYVKGVIKEAAQEAIRENIDACKPRLKELIAKELAKDETIDAFVKEFTGSMARAEALQGGEAMTIRQITEVTCDRCGAKVTGSDYAGIRIHEGGSFGDEVNRVELCPSCYSLLGNFLDGELLEQQHCKMIVRMQERIDNIERWKRWTGECSCCGAIFDERDSPGILTAPKFCPCCGSLCDGMEVAE